MGSVGISFRGFRGINDAVRRARLGAPVAKITRLARTRRSPLTAISLQRDRGVVIAYTTV